MCVSYICTCLHKNPMAISSKQKELSFSHACCLCSHVVTLLLIGMYVPVVLPIQYKFLSTHTCITYLYMVMQSWSPIRSIEMVFWVSFHTHYPCYPSSHATLNCFGFPQKTVIPIIKPFHHKSKYHSHTCLCKVSWL